MNAPERRPNILLITTDQQRYDTLGVCGSRVARTPCLDRLAGESVVFDRAYVQNPVCIPSRACIQTGRYTHQHGVRYMESIIDTTPGLPAWELTFMERLQAAGYNTGATGKIHMMPERGFDWMELCGGKGARWTQQAGQDIGPAPLGRQYAEWLEARHPGGYEKIYEQRRRPEYKRQFASVVNDLPLEDYIETYILEKSIEFISAERDQPFMLWCGFCGPHGPHDPPASHAGLYPPETLSLPATFDADLSGKPAFLQGRPFARRDPADLRVYMSYYYALVTLIDEMVGKLLHTLDARGLLNNTLVVYTTDHGEMLCDFARGGKGNFYEPVIHTPMLIRPPGGVESGRRFNGLVEAMDLAPTFLDYAGVSIPEQMQATTLRPILEGGDGGHEGVLCEYTTNDQRISGTCLTTDRYKLAVWTEGCGELYDLQEDPSELRNLWDEPSHRAVRDEHVQRLFERLMASGRPYTGGREHPD